MVERMTLVSKHGLPVDDSLICLVVMQGCCLMGASADRDVGCNSSGEVVLLAVEFKKALELRLSHAWLDVLHDINMAFNCDLGSPFQRQNFLVVLVNT
jgi:hypothetical protein